MDAFQMIEAGADGKLTSIPEGARYSFNESNEAEYHYGREAMHRMLYTIVNSKAMNGAMPGSEFKEGVQIVQKLQIGVSVIGGGLILLMVFLTYRRFRRRNPIVVEKIDN